LVQRSAAARRSCRIHEPGKLSQWQCHDDSTINIVSFIVTITTTSSAICSWLYHAVQSVVGLRCTCVPLCAWDKSKNALRRRRVCSIRFRYVPAVFSISSNFFTKPSDHTSQQNSDHITHLLQSDASVNVKKLQVIITLLRWAWLVVGWVTV